MTRERGFEIAEKSDTETGGPGGLHLEITELTEEEFVRVLESQRRGKAKEPD